MARKQLSPVERIKKRHERRLKFLEQKKANIRGMYEDEIAQIDSALIETRAILAQLSK